MSATGILRLVTLISLAGAAPMAAQAVPAPLPRLTSQHPLVLRLQSPPPRMSYQDDSSDPVESVLTWAAVGALFGIGLSFYATCTYSEDPSCPGRTIGISALVGAFLGLLAM